MDALQLYRRKPTPELLITSHTVHSVDLRPLDTILPRDKSYVFIIIKAAKINFIFLRYTHESEDTRVDANRPLFTERITDQQ